MTDVALSNELMRLDRIAHKLLGDLLTHFRDRVPLWVLETRVIACRASEAPSSASLMTGSEVRAWFTGRAADLRDQLRSLMLVMPVDEAHLRLVGDIDAIVGGVERRWQVGYLGVLWESIPEDTPKNAWWSGFGDENTLMDDLVLMTDGVATRDPQHDEDEREYAGAGLWTGEFEEGDTMLDYWRQLYPEHVSNCFVFMR